MFDCSSSTVVLYYSHLGFIMHFCHPVTDPYNAAGQAPHCRTLVTLLAYLHIPACRRHRHGPLIRIRRQLSKSSAVYEVA